MTSTKTRARIAGALYLLVAIGGGFAQSVRLSVVGGDAAATAANIAQHAALFRTALAADLVDFVCFLGIGLLLYGLLKPVNPEVALTMLVINAVSVAMQAINMTLHAAALLVATSPAYGASTSSAQLFLDLHQQGYLASQVFFGLYLLPLGYLVFRSRMFPRALGVVLIVGCGGYLAGVAASYLSPTLESSTATYFGLLGGVAEICFLLWLLIIGARVSATAPARSAREALA